LLVTAMTEEERKKRGAKSAVIVERLVRVQLRAIGGMAITMCAQGFVSGVRSDWRGLEPQRQAKSAEIRARIASACAMLWVRNHASNRARSASLTSTAHLLTSMRLRRTNPILISEALH
jgi:hypothetical protein